MISKIRVKGMHCKSCEMLIADELLDMVGVKTATASEEEGLAMVEFDEGKVSIDDIKKVIRKEGFKVE